MLGMQLRTLVIVGSKVPGGPEGSWAVGGTREEEGGPRGWEGPKLSGSSCHPWLSIYKPGP